MVNDDTIRLLRECDAGVRMGVSSIEDVLGDIESERMREALLASKRSHEALGAEIEDLLYQYGDEGKEPGIMATGMSKMKTGVKMALEHTDATIADLMTDGCNMGVKSLGRYLNQYKAAEEKVKDITKRLMKEEEDLAANLREYL